MFIYELVRGKTMAFISTAAVGIGINLITNLVVDLQTTVSNKLFKRQIIHKLQDFNSEYENTQLDTKSFSDIVESEDLTNCLYNYVFKNTGNYKSKTLFISDLVDEVTNKINEKNKLFSRPLFDNRELLNYYLTGLIDLLIEIKNENFTDDELRIISTITQAIVENREEIIGEVKEQFRIQKLDNQFAEETINKIVLYNQFYDLDAATESFQRIVQNKDQISNSQYLRVLVEYSRTCSFIKNYKKISDIIQEISLIPNSEKYIYEIKFIKSLSLNEEETISECIGYFGNNNYSDEVLALKRCEVHKINGEYDKIKNEILNKDGDLKMNLLDFSDAHFYRGLFYTICKGELITSDFEKAMEINPSIIYEFYKDLISMNVYLKDNNEGQVLITYERFQKYEGIIDYLDSVEKLNYWKIRLLMTQIYEVDNLEHIEGILKRNDFYNISILKRILASAFAESWNLNNALEIIESIENPSEEDLVLLFNLLLNLGEFNNITDKYMMLDEFKDNPEIELIYYLAEFNKDPVNEKLTIIKSYITTKNLLSCYFISIQFFGKFSSENFNQIYEQIVENILTLNLNEQTIIINEIYKLKYKKEAQKLIFLLSELNGTLLSILAKTIDVTSSSKELLKIKQNIDAINEKYIHSHLLYKSIYIDLNLKTITKKTFDNIEALNNIYEDKKTIAYFMLNAKWIIDDYSNTEKYVQVLIDSDNADERLLAALILAKTNQFEIANKVAIQGMYLSKDSIDEYIANKLFAIWQDQLGSIHDNDNPPKIDENNIVLIIKKSTEVKNIAIVNEDIITIDDESEIFGAIHYSSKSLKITQLRAQYKLYGKIKLNDKEYDLEEIISLQTHLFRFILNYSVNNLSNMPIKVISTTKITDLAKQLKSVLNDTLESEQLIIDMYNFKINEVGLPISKLAAPNNLADYRKAYYYLLTKENQSLFVPELIIKKNNKYVLTISSLLFFTHYNLLDSLESIKEKLFISSYTYTRINLLLQNLLSEKEGARGTLNLLEDQIISSMRDSRIITSEIEEWLNLTTFLSGVSIRDSNIPHDRLIIEINSLLLNDDKYAIDLSEKLDSTLVVDDLFIARLVSLTSLNTVQCNSSIGIIISEDILELDKLFELLTKLLNDGYTPCISGELIMAILYKLKSKKTNTEYYIEEFRKFMDILYVRYPDLKRRLNEYFYFK